MTYYTLDQSRCTAEPDLIRDRALTALKNLQQATLPLLEVPSWTQDLQEIQELASHIRSHFSHLVVLGTGGSSLGGRMLAQVPESLPMDITFLENIDPHTVEKTLARYDVRKTFFLAISKSGGTVETLAQTLICLQAIRSYLGDSAVSRQCAIITGPQDSPLLRLAKNWHIPVITHPDVGGRFSVLTAVGLIPAAVAGLDISRIRAGANSVVKAMRDATNIEDSLPVMGAATLFGLLQKGITISVLMPYCDRLFDMGAWYRQLWAESLGKDGQGMTPVRALGAVDQHSQLQLYLDGPKDKLLSLICVEYAGKGHLIPSDLLEDPSLNYLMGHRIGDVIDAEQQATADTLSAKGCPVRLFRLPEVKEESFGALLMHFMIETIIMADLMGVNAFDQPAVEDGKQRTRDLLQARKN